MYFRVTFIAICCLLAVNGANSYNLYPSLHNEDSPIESTFQRDFNLKSPAVTTITRASADFCQVRVDFTTFHIGEADSNGTCSEGWTASGHNNTNNVPNVICGLNDGQHVYLNFANDNPITLVTVFDDSTGVDSWNFKFTQVACDDTDNLAPSDCLQYYKESTGNVKSFNFRSIEAAANPPVTYQLANAHYYVCIGASSSSYSRITWTKAVGSSSYYFVLTEAIELVPASIAGTVDAAEFDDACVDTSPSYDYVEIVNGNFKGSDGSTTSASKFCGVGFPSSVTSTVTPFRMYFYSNGNEHSREGSVGFSLSYILG